MAKQYDPNTFRIDTFITQAMNTDPAEFTAGMRRLADQLRTNSQIPAHIDPYGIPLPPSNDDFILPPHLQYAALWNSYKKFYYYYFDEALRDSPQNMLAMRRDLFIHKLLRHRQLPTVSLDWEIVSDDPDDKEQTKVAQQVSKVWERTRRLQAMKLWLKEDIYYGKSGVQLTTGKKRIAGQERIYIANWSPIQGDKIQYKWDGTPGVLVYMGTEWKDRADIAPYISTSTLGYTFWLYNKKYRKNFIISSFEPSDFDYLWEGEKAGAVHGIGYRDRMYWMWNMRTEVLSWQLDALQRVGANGMLYAFFQSGNPQAMWETVNALKMLVKENVAAFPMLPGGMVNNEIKNIEPSPVGYDVMFQLMEYFDQIMHESVLGQMGSMKGEATGLGSGQSEFHADMFQNYILFDARCLDEDITDQGLPFIVDQNVWEYKGKKVRGNELPFGMVYKSKLDRENIDKLVDAAGKVVSMGGQIDIDDIRDKLGLAAPKNATTALGAQATPGSAVPGSPGGPGRPPVIVGTPANAGTPKKPVAPLLASNGNGHAAQAARPFMVHSSPERFSKHADVEDVGIDIRLTFIPVLREEHRLPTQKEWTLANDSGPAVILRTDASGRGPTDLLYYDAGRGDYVKRQTYTADRFSDADRDAAGLARWLVNAGTSSQVVRVMSLDDFDHAQFHGFRRSEMTVLGKVVGSPASPVNLWEEDLEVLVPEQFAKDRSVDPGVMICLPIDPETATKLLEPFQEANLSGHALESADDLHITLAYLGRLSTLGQAIVDEAQGIAEAMAEHYPALAGSLKTINRFPATEHSDGQDVIWAKPDIPGLAEFRSDLCEILDRAGIPYSKDFKYQPHITLAYIPKGAPCPLEGKIDAIPLELGELALVVGGRAKRFAFRSFMETIS